MAAAGVPMRWVSHLGSGVRVSAAAGRVRARRAGVKRVSMHCRSRLKNIAVSQEKYKADLEKYKKIEQSADQKELS